MFHSLPFLAALAYAIVPLAHNVLWLGYCYMVVRFDPENASKIIAASGRWAPKRLPPLPWGKGSNSQTS
jgi:hypothetical protein